MVVVVIFGSQGDCSGGLQWARGERWRRLEVSGGFA